MKKKKVTPEMLKDYFAQLGRKGGRAGTIADKKHAANIRWEKERAKAGK